MEESNEVIPIEDLNAQGTTSREAGMVTINLNDAPAKPRSANLLSLVGQAMASSTRMPAIRYAPRLGSGGRAPRTFTQRAPSSQEDLRKEPPPAYKCGRNEPCPCGSGKKFKKCHGGPANNSPPKKEGQ